MSDQRRRAYERAAAQGDTQARARYLAERLRGGELTNEDLVAAAMLGDGEAAVALNIRVEQHHPRTLPEFQQWLGAITPHKEQASHRAYLALARAAYERTHKQSKDAVLERALDLAEEFLLLPVLTDTADILIQEREVELAAERSVERAEVLLAHLDDVPDLGQNEDVWQLWQEQYAARAVSYTAHIVAGRAIAPETSALATTARTMTPLTRIADIDYPQAFANMQKVVQAELLPWILNERDPLRERVEARAAARSQVANKEGRAKQADEVRQRLEEHPES